MLLTLLKFASEPVARRRAPPDTEAEDAHKKFVLNGRNGSAMALTFIVRNHRPSGPGCPALSAITAVFALTGLLWCIGRWERWRMQSA